MPAPATGAAVRSRFAPSPTGSLQIGNARTAPFHCRDRGLTPGGDRSVVVRFRSPDEGVTAFTDAIRGEVVFPNADLEDFVIVRSNGEPMFLVANAVDDADAGVTHIMRGEDLLNV